MKYVVYAFTEDGEPIEMSHIPESEMHHLELLLEHVQHRCPECARNENSELYARKRTKGKISPFQHPNDLMR